MQKAGFLIPRLILCIIEIRCFFISILGKSTDFEPISVFTLGVCIRVLLALKMVYTCTIILVKELSQRLTMIYEPRDEKT